MEKQAYITYLAIIAGIITLLTGLISLLNKLLEINEGLVLIISWIFIAALVVLLILSIFYFAKRFFSLIKTRRNIDIIIGLYLDKGINGIEKESLEKYIPYTLICLTEILTEIKSINFIETEKVTCIFRELVKQKIKIEESNKLKTKSINPKLRILLRNFKILFFAPYGFFLLILIFGATMGVVFSNEDFSLIVDMVKYSTILGGLLFVFSIVITTLELSEKK